MKEKEINGEAVLYMWRSASNTFFDILCLSHSMIEYNSCEFHTLFGGTHSQISLTHMNFTQS